MYEQALKELGLTSKEVDTYLGNLQLGSALVQEIAQQSGLNRTSTYDILQSLQTKGFASYTIQSGKRYYQVIEPKEILQLIA
jgi:sugar-specific transcriptional regulator TrmB